MLFWMKTSLVANLAILVPVCSSLARATRQPSSEITKRMNYVYGIDTNARRILTCMYTSLGIASGAILVFPQNLEMYAPAVLGFQILYKLQTAAVLPLNNPVLIANLGVSCLHTITLYQWYYNNNGGGAK